MTRYPNVYSRSTLRNGNRIAAAGLWGMALACALLVCAPAAHGGPRTHRKGDQCTYKAAISDLQGNITTGTHIHISGTNLSVHMTVRNSWPNTDHTVSIRLGTSELAAGASCVRVDPVSEAGQPIIRTDSRGNWEGRIYFASTGLPTGTGGEEGLPLKVRLSSTGHPPFDSTAINYVQVYNKAYVIGSQEDQRMWNPACQANTACEQQMNHSVTPHELLANAPDIKSVLGSYTVFMTCCHGLWDEPPYNNQTILLDSSYRRDPPDNNVGTHGVPSSQIPEKGDMQPFYNLVHAHSCDSAGIASEAHIDMAHAFRIVTIDNQKKANRAYLGLQGIGFLEDWKWAGEIWDQLALGKTIQGACNEADRLYPSMSSYLIFGDRNTTLNSVYCGTIF